MVRWFVSIPAVALTAALVLGAVAGDVAPIAAAAGQAATKSVWDGVYAAAQAERGKATFATTCSGCHGTDLGGATGPDLVGTRFMNKWDFQTANQLFSEIKTRMPRNNPGTLTDDAYLDLVTYIFQANGFPAGTGELTAEPTMLLGIRIQKQAGAAAAELPTGALAQLVGCLAQAPGNNWMITNASAPVRTDNPDASKGEQRKALDTVPLGNQTFQLVNVFTALDEHKGHKMEVKGFLIRSSEGDRVNVAAIEMIGSGCGQ
jgi:mono/diheme cytochrome c family protein